MSKRIMVSTFPIGERLVQKPRHLLPTVFSQSQRHGVCPMRKLFRQSTFALVVMVLGLTGFSTSIAPSSEPQTVFGAVGTLSLSCDQCEDLITGDYISHAFTGFGAAMDCQTFNSCHPDWQIGYCTAWHCGCQAETCGSNTEVRSVALEQPLPAETEVRRLSHGTNGSEVRQFLHANSERVSYNRDRSVIQIMGCGGRVQAQFAVPRSVADYFDQAASAGDTR